MIITVTIYDNNNNKNNNDNISVILTNSIDNYIINIHQ